MSEAAVSDVWKQHSWWQTDINLFYEMYICSPFDTKALAFIDLSLNRYFIKANFN